MAFQPLSPELRQRALQIAGSYNANNTAPMKRAASALEKAGRKGDTELVHVTPGELSLLETIGSGTTNPVTGLREFFRGDQQSKDVEGRDSPEGTDAGDVSDTSGGDDPFGMADVAAAAEEATRGMSDEERTEAAEAAVAAMDRESRDSDRDAEQEAISGLVEQAIQTGLEGTDLGDAATISAGAAAISPREAPRGGITGAIQNALDRNKDGKISAGEAAFGIASVATPIGPMTALGKGLENLVTGLQFGTELGSDQTGMIAEQQRGLYGDEEEGRDDSDREEREAEVEEVPEELTVEALTRPPTIDIVPFRPQDFYYFTPGSFAYNRGIPSMMNMRNR